MRLNNLIESIDYIELVNCDNTAIDIDGISYNSKQTEQNNVFVCLVGEHVDGHEGQHKRHAKQSDRGVTEERGEQQNRQLGCDTVDKHARSGEFWEIAIFLRYFSA